MRRGRPLVPGQLPLWPDAPDERVRALRPGAVLVARMAAAFRDGEATAVQGQPRRIPYRGDAATARERVLAIMWARGYSAGNPVPDIEA